MKKVAITGGIGSGKSVISEFLQMIGYPVYNSDEQSKHLLNEDQNLREKLCETFGYDLYKDGQLDKVLFANIIFGDEKLLEEANRIIHPAVYQDFERWSMKQTSDIVFAETALYFQNKEGKKHIPFSILVQAPLELRIQRAMQRDNCSEEDILARIKNQISDEVISYLSDYHILNDERHLIIPQVLLIIKKLKLKNV